LTPIREYRHTHNTNDFDVSLLIKESYWIVGGFNVIAYALAAIGLVSPVITTLISNGSAVVACANGMKPLIKMKLSSGKKEQPDYVSNQLVGRLAISAGDNAEQQKVEDGVQYQRDETTHEDNIGLH